MADITDVSRFAVSPVSGEKMGNQSVNDSNLHVYNTLYIPVGETDTLNGGKDRDGAIRITKGKFKFYHDGVWKEVGKPLKASNGLHIDEATGDVQLGGKLTGGAIIGKGDYWSGSNISLMPNNKGGIEIFQVRVITEPDDPFRPDFITQLQLDSSNIALSINARGSYSGLAITPGSTSLSVGNSDSKVRGITYGVDESTSMVVKDEIGLRGLGDAADYSATKQDLDYVTKKMLNTAIGNIPISPVITASSGLHIDESTGDIQLGGETISNDYKNNIRFSPFNFRVINSVENEKKSAILSTETIFGSAQTQLSARNTEINKDTTFIINTETGARINDQIIKKGIKLADDYSLNFTPDDGNYLAPKAYVDRAIAAIPIPTPETSNPVVIVTDSVYNVQPTDRYIIINSTIEDDITINFPPPSTTTSKVFYIARQSSHSIVVGTTRSDREMQSTDYNIEYNYDKIDGSVLGEKRRGWYKSLNGGFGAYISTGDFYVRLY